MSYESALEAAGAKVIAFEEFGSYQGEWYALVEFNGERGWINGGYGSCSGCDAFEREFGWTEDECSEHKYDGHKPACEGCIAAKADYTRRLAEFGATYLGTMLTQEQAEAEATRNIEWDSDAEEMLAFVRSHAEAN